VHSTTPSPACSRMPRLSEAQGLAGDALEVMVRVIAYQGHQTTAVALRAPRRKLFAGEGVRQSARSLEPAINRRQVRMQVFGSALVNRGGIGGMHRAGRRHAGIGSIATAPLIEPARTRASPCTAWLTPFSLAGRARRCNPLESILHPGAAGFRPRHPRRPPFNDGGRARMGSALVPAAA